MLDVVTFHAEHYYSQMAAESALFGVRPLHHPALYRRVLEEYQRADAIRVMSEPARQSFLDRGFPSERVFVVPPVFDVAEFPQAQFNGSRFTVSFVGLLEPAKGFHHLIQAFRKLNRPEAELLLWGNTGARPLARYVNQEIAGCPAIQLRPYSVTLLGYENVYGISSVLVHPSLADGFGYVVGEAMASGIPVITTTTAGASQWVIDGVNGYVVPPRDVDAIRDRLEFLMDHPSLLREMGRAARETISQLTIERFRQCYTEGIAAASKSTPNKGRMTTCQTQQV
jgi:glycosyltransferase involved in cell wall biosynthesis